MLSLNTINNMSKEVYDLLCEVNNIFCMHEFISYNGIKEVLDNHNIKYSIEDLNYVINLLVF